MASTLIESATSADERIGKIGAAHTGAALSSVTNAVNTTGKRAGLMKFNTTTNRPVWAVGPLATDIWVYADGTTAATPV